MCHALPCGAHANSGAMNNLPRAFLAIHFVRYIAFCWYTISNEIDDLQRDINGNRAARDTVFFSASAFAFSFLQLLIYLVSNFNIVFCAFYYWWSAWTVGRSNETWDMHQYEFVFVHRELCVGRRRCNVCHNSDCIRAELSHYNLTLYLHCHVDWMMLCIIMKSDANAHNIY